MSNLDELHTLLTEQRLDLADRGVHHALLPDALALLHHLHDHS